MPDHVEPPHATATAAETVKRHSEPQDLVFHAGWFCPFVQRAWIALEEKGVPYQYNEVNPYKKEPHFLKLNPKGLVPALEHHGKALYESLVLLEYLEDAYPSAPALRPRDAHEAGIVRLALQHISNVVVPTFYRYVQAQEPEKQAEGKQAFVKVLQDTYEQWFVKGDAQWARGNDFGWIEAALVPWVARFPLLEKHRAFNIDDVGPEFKAWAQRALDRPSVKATTSEAKAYEKIYRRYFEDTAESEVAKATRKGEWLK
ncbi:glutathione S-transferase family protein [Rhodotorula paludigena]|uniref:glutathione S-transferase family protein n=1 Tax=Rhodotorula paludigena TaxID=86838 RepID=UPI00317CAC1D